VLNNKLTQYEGIMKSTFATLLILASLNSGASVIKEAWNNANSPERMQVTRNNQRYLVGKYNYKKNFYDLPTEGALSTRPWSGDYWPTYKGGITNRWHSESYWETANYDYDIISTEEIKNLTETEYLSPAEKYDLFIGRYDFPLTNHERSRTNIMRTVEGSDQYDPDFEIPTWEGLCHSWAPATLAYKNPGPATLTNKDGIEVKFGASDVKALLTFFLHYDKTAANFFLGGRCNTNFEELRTELRNGDITQEEYDRQVNTMKCRDTNAGAFHMVLTNQVGLLNEGFIVDVTRDLEVWNQAVHEYSTRIVKETKGASKGAARGTVKEIEVITKMHYTVEVDAEWSMVPADNYRAESINTYHYRLELNKKDEIIGGEWISEDRPDFLWKQTVPEFSGFFKQLEEIYNESVK
jgi:hypothetical protein